MSWLFIPMRGCEFEVVSEKARKHEVIYPHEGL